MDDNYILLYLGYHLKEANLIDEFPRVFLNLLFVEKKIMNYGVADLLLDYKKYKSLIANVSIILIWILFKNIYLILSK